MIARERVVSGVRDQLMNLMRDKWSWMLDGGGNDERADQQGGTSGENRKKDGLLIVLFPRKP